MSDGTMTTEAFVAGALLVSPVARREAATRGLTGSAITDGRLAEVVDAVMVLTQRDGVVDIVTVTHELGRMGSSVTGDEVERVAERVLTYGTPELAGHYLDLLDEQSRHRERLAAIMAIAGRIRADPDYDPTADVVAMAREESHRDETTGALLSEIMAELLADAERRYASTDPGSITALSTGLPSLDATLHGGGLHPGELVIVAGRPGMAKTAFATQIAMNVARRGRRVLVISAEMTRRALGRRMAIEHTGLPAPLFDGNGPAGHPNLDDRRHAALAQIRAEVARLPIYVHDASRPTVADMARCIDRHGPFALVVFDYTSLAGDVVRQDSEERRMAQIALGLQQLAKDHAVPVIGLHQLNRAVESVKPYLPTLAHLRDSGQVEANAHIVWLLYRHQYYVAQGMLDEDPAREHELSVIVAKNREGETGSVGLHFTGDTFRIREQGWQR